MLEEKCASLEVVHGIEKVCVDCLRLSLHCARNFSAFLRETIEPGEQWMRANLAVRCWNKQMLKHALPAFLPSMHLLGVDLPALVCLHLIKQRKRSGEQLSHTLKDQLSLGSVHRDLQSLSGSCVGLCCQALPAQALVR